MEALDRLPVKALHEGRDGVAKARFKFLFALGSRVSALGHRLHQRVYFVAGLLHSDDGPLPYRHPARLALERPAASADTALARHLVVIAEGLHAARRHAQHKLAHLLVAYLQPTPRVRLHAFDKLVVQFSARHTIAPTLGARWGRGIRGCPWHALVHYGANLP